jgi:tRNA A-37 threonylcarbamoyl transferase component Bud32
VFSYGLAQDADGGIVIGSALGVHRFFRGRLENILPDVPAGEVVGIAPGVLLATGLRKPDLSEGSLYRIRMLNGRWQAAPLAGLRKGAIITRDRSGAILAACPGGWCEWSARSIEDWSPDRPGHSIFHKSALDVGRVLRDRFGCLWFRFNEGAAYQCPGDPEPVSLPASIAGRNVWADVRENDDGSMLFANVGSLAVGRPGSFQVALPANGLPPDAVTCAVRARDGSIWVGAIGGLYRFPYPFRLTYWKSRYGLFWSFARSAGGMFAGTSAGVARLSPDGEWTVLPGTREFGSIGSLLPGRDGSIYAAVSQEAVVQLRPDGTVGARTLPGAGGRAQALAHAADGTIWLAGSGFYRVIPNGRELSLIAENPPGGPPSDAFLTSDPAGGLWGCFAGNLVRREAGIWLSVAHGGLPQALCRALAFPQNGDVWAGYTSGFAVVHRDAQGAATVREFKSGGDTGNSTTFAFGSDTRGWLWRGSTDGAYAATAAQAQAGVWVHLNEIDGLTDLDVNHGSFFGDPDGSVWWGAAASVVHFFPPPDLLDSSNPAPVFLSAFSVSGAPSRLAETIQEFPGGKKLTAHLGSLQFQGRNALRVRYRLLPGQKDWRESSALDLDLGSPWWGTHNLEIQSRLSIGQWSPTWSRRLVVLRPWWFSWPSLLALVGIGFGGARGVAWRRKQKARAEAHLPDLAGWRVAALSPESQLMGATLDGRFQVLGLVARGGFATVLKGRDLLHAGRPCAIKIFRRDVLDEQWLAHRFQQEVSALEQIRHPSVVSIYGHGTSPEGAPYLVMEFIEGGTLRNLLDAGPPALPHTAALLMQAAAALEQIHAHGIYHRDLKPENLMLRAAAPAGEELVLIDFSIAIVKEPDQTIHGLSRAAGTIYYMAPEQAVGFATPASDVYSLAKIVLEMLTGRRLSILLPHASMDLPARVCELVRGMSIRWSEVSVELLGSALEFDPSRRPQSAMEFARPIVRDLTESSSDPSANPCP